MNVAALVVHGTDLLITLYQLARSYPAFVQASIEEENGEGIEALIEEHIEAGSIEEEAIIGTVEGDMNIDVEGDVYLVPESDIDWMEIAQYDREE